MVVGVIAHRLERKKLSKTSLFPVVKKEAGQQGGGQLRTDQK